MDPYITCFNISEFFKVKHTHISAYHPSSNGLVERANATIMKIVRPMVMDNPTIWDQMLPMAVFAYNSGYQRAIKESPHFLLYHVDPQIPYDKVFSQPAPWYTLESYKEQMALIAAKTFRRVQDCLDEMQKENIFAAQGTMCVSKTQLRRSAPNLI